MTTALITGASSGIGAGFADRFARLGHDLVLVARRVERLEAHAARLREQWRVDVEVLPADLGTDSGCAAVESRLAEAARPVDVLVNNAGFGLGIDLLHSTVEQEETLLRVMVRAPMRLTKAALPEMLARDRGVIVNVSSVAGLVSHNSYGAAKAWGVRFSEALALQLAGTGVRTIALCPGLVHTEFHQRGSVDISGAPSWMWLDVETVVDECLRDLRRGKTVSIPSTRYRLVTAVGRHLPSAFTGRIARSRGRLPLRRQPHKRSTRA